jgi:hypothetical protein
VLGPEPARPCRKHRDRPTSLPRELGGAGESATSSSRPHVHRSYLRTVRRTGKVFVGSLRTSLPVSMPSMQWTGDQREVMRASGMLPALISLLGATHSDGCNVHRRGKSSGRCFGSMFSPFSPAPRSCPCKVGQAWPERLPWRWRSYWSVLPGASATPSATSRGTCFLKL